MRSLWRTSAVALVAAAAVFGEDENGVTGEVVQSPAAVAAPPVLLDEAAAPEAEEGERGSIFGGLMEGAAGSARDYVDGFMKKLNERREATAPKPYEYSREQLLLTSLHASHGRLEPATISESTRKLTLFVDEPVSYIGLMPELNHSCLPPDLNSQAPLVTMSWPQMGSVPERESFSYAIRKQIKLPEDGSDLKIMIQVRPPPAAAAFGATPRDELKYELTVKQQYAPPGELVRLEGTDAATHKGVLIEPVLNPAVSRYRVYVAPNAKKIDLDLHCNKGASLRVNGHAASNGYVRISRELWHHTQLVEVSCVKKSQHEGTPADRRYVLELVSDFLPEEIPPPRSLEIATTGTQCEFEEEKGRFRCPAVKLPKQANNRVQMLSEIEPQIKYILGTSSLNPAVRLNNQRPTVPIKLQTGLQIIAESGRYTRVWPVVFEGSGLRSLMYKLGWVLAGSLAVLLAALALVVGVASTMAMGVPVGATEIAATMTFILQYLCFAQFLRGSGKLMDFVQPIKWVTLFWPYPWQPESTGYTEYEEYRVGRQLAAVNAATQRNVPPPNPWEHMGDLADWRNACGAVFWAEILLALFLVVHGSILFKFYVVDARYTIPNRVKLGNWESRCLHWLAFPQITGATYVLASPYPSVGWKVAAGCVIAFYVLWIGAVFIDVQSSVASGRVTWMWNASVREDGQLEDDSGMWIDAVSDQLLTQPVNRSLCRGFFPFTWISTVADIVPVALNPALMAAGSRGLNPPQKYNRSYMEPGYVMGKAPQVVEAVRCRSPKQPCTGQRLIAGLFRTQWLDTLLTYQALTRFHAECSNDAAHQFVVPLVVKTSQLAGPISSGRQAFFFDGVRMPFTRIATFIYRVLVGVCIGVALTAKGRACDIAMFAIIATLSLAMLLYVAVLRPYSRLLENWLEVGVFSVVAASAVSLSVLHGGSWEYSGTVADVFLGLTITCCFVLAAYSFVVTFSVIAAVCCPPLEETRFLEKLANSSLVISKESATERWFVDVPAYTKYPAKDLQMRVTQTGARRCHVAVHATRSEPSFEFSCEQMKRACQTGYLPVPLATVFVADPSTTLGYRHFVVDGTEKVAEKIGRFLAKSPAAGFNEYAQSEVGRYVESELATRGKAGRCLLCITVISTTNK